MSESEGGQDPRLVRIECTSGVAIVEICRAQRHNALSSALLTELLAAFGTIERRYQPRAVVLAAAGAGAFCSGGDIAEMAAMSDEAAMEYIALGKACALAIEALPVPTIAAVHGPALGGGLELALACDLIVAASSASLGLPEVRLGIIPGFGGIPRLVRRIGFSRAKTMVLRGNTVKAATALEWGLVDAACETNSVRPLANEWAADFARASTSAITAAKSALSECGLVDLRGGLHAESTHFRTAFQSVDRTEGLQAFLSRRSPDFSRTR
jgi:enoyl-CoA hydratase/carnithine racemase